METCARAAVNPFCRARAAFEVFDGAQAVAWWVVCAQPFGIAFGPWLTSGLIGKEGHGECRSSGTSCCTWVESCREADSPLFQEAPAWPVVNQLSHPHMHGICKVTVARSCTRYRAFMVAVSPKEEAAILQIAGCVCNLGRPLVAWHQGKKAHVDVIQFLADA